MSVDLTIVIGVKCELLLFGGDRGVPGGIVVGVGPIVDMEVDAVHVGTVVFIAKIHNNISIDLNVRTAFARQAQATPSEIHETPQPLKNRPARFLNFPL